MNRLEELLKQAIEEFESKGNTPEELGELLAVATMSPVQRGLYSDDFVKDYNGRRNTARVQIRQLKDGKELLRLEEKFMYG